MKKYVIQFRGHKSRYDFKVVWSTSDNQQFNTLEEAKAAYDRLRFKSDYRIAEAYTVVRYKPVKL